MSMESNNKWTIFGEDLHEDEHGRVTCPDGTRFATLSEGDYLLAESEDEAGFYPQLPEHLKSWHCGKSNFVKQNLVLGLLTKCGIII